MNKKLYRLILKASLLNHISEDGDKKTRESYYYIDAIKRARLKPLKKTDEPATTKKESSSSIYNVAFCPLLS